MAFIIRRRESIILGAAAAADDDPILQYVVLRKDLWRDLAWPLGSIVAQGCHASTAALWQSRKDAVTQEYCADSNLDSMRKVMGDAITR